MCLHGHFLGILSSGWIIKHFVQKYLSCDYGIGRWRIMISFTKQNMSYGIVEGIIKENKKPSSMEEDKVTQTGDESIHITTIGDIILASALL